MLILHLHFKKSEHFYIPRLKINKSECWTFNSLIRDNERLEYILTTRLKNVCENMVAASRRNTCKLAHVLQLSYVPPPAPLSTCHPPGPGRAWLTEHSQSAR